MKIAVYCGANHGRNKHYAKAALRLGDYLGSHGHTLIYGGGAAGLMGKIAAQVRASGGKVIGIRPAFLSAYEQPDEAETDIIVTSMADRKRQMIDLSDAFIAMPGGVGTLDEISEIMSLIRLKQLKGPCILYNVDGYYSGLKYFLRHMLEEGFVDEATFHRIVFASTLDEIIDLIRA